MSTTRYEVPPGGGFYVDVPGIWQGGEVIEVDEDTHQVTVLSGPKDQTEEPVATKERPQPASSGPAQ